jgi:hypothetical protein
VVVQEDIQNMVMEVLVAAVLGLWDWGPGRLVRVIMAEMALVLKVTMALAAAVVAALLACQQTLTLAADGMVVLAAGASQKMLTQPLGLITAASAAAVLTSLSLATTTMSAALAAAGLGQMHLLLLEVAGMAPPILAAVGAVGEPTTPIMLARAAPALP